MENIKRELEETPTTESQNESKKVKLEEPSYSTPFPEYSPPLSPRPPLIVSPSLSSPTAPATPTLPPPTASSQPNDFPRPLTSPTPSTQKSESETKSEIKNETLSNPAQANTNAPGTSTVKDTSQSGDAKNIDKGLTGNRGNYESHRGRGKKGRGGKQPNKRGRKGRDEKDEGEEVIGEGGAEDEDDVMDDEVAKDPIKAHEVDLAALDAVRISTDPAARKKKVAMLVGYNGSGFCGMQRNPGVRTIEDELEVAIYKAGGITKDNFRALPKVDWMRCARTDKGVSALGNVVSFKVEMSPPTLDEMQNRINKFLDPAIRIFSMRRVNKKFNAKMAVNARSYEYVVPIFAFAPAHNETKNTTTETTKPAETTTTSETTIKNELLETTNTDEKPKPTSSNFEFTDQMRQKINQVLALYVGTHRFHNFTFGKKPTEESAKRYIMSFSCGPVIEQNGMQLVVLNVVGQSFMLHQIRKMVGMLIALARSGYLQDDSLEKVKKIFSTATSKGVFAVPMAPSLGLLLEKCIYSAWDKKFASEFGSLNFDEAEEERVNFKAQIYGYIVEKEKEEKVMKNWCATVVDIYHKDFTSMLNYAEK